MTEFRNVRICEADITWVEEALYALYRHGETELAPKIMVLALRMRTGTGFTPELPVPDNVFELGTYSRRVPCA